MSDDSDFRNKSDERRKRPLKAASSSESLDSGSPLPPAKNPRTQLALSSNSSEDTDSDIDNDFLRTLRSKKKRAECDDDSSSSENEEIITGRPRRAIPIQSDYESGESNTDEGDSSESSSDNEGDKKTKPESEKNRLNDPDSDLSSDGDGQSERCPICLARFHAQEIGTPESCDHCFCAVCLQEWAKNVNTCPVDRQPFTLILIREHLEGKVVRQIPVSPPTETQEVLDDATFCEVCGRSDREESMLLCDHCDQGYHMECLTPPLQHVPVDEWYCPECAPRRTRTRRTSVGEVIHRQSEEEEEEEHEAGQEQHRQRPAPRLLPRTRQSERVRTSVRDQRRTRQLATAVQPSTSSGVDLSPEGERRAVSRPRQQVRPRRRKRRRRLPAVRVKKIFTEDGVIEVQLKRKKKRKYQKKRKQRTLRAAPRSAKGRLATRLGLCAPRIPRQTIPETLNRQELSAAPINHQRHQAGLPTLDIFGRRDQLDYFSGSDGGVDEEAEGGGGGGLLSRAVVSRPADRLTRLKRAKDVLSSTSLRRPRKTERIETPAPASSSSLLDSILDSQTLWHSKKTQIKSKSDGSLQVILPEQSKQVVKEEKNIDVKTCTAPVVQAMYSTGRGGSGGFQSESTSRGGDDHENRGVDMTHPRDGGQQTSSGVSSGGGGGGGGGGSGSTFPLRSTAPIRFRMSAPPRRPNIHSYPTDNIPPPPPARLRSPNIESTFPVSNSPENSPQREDEDVDIYSDIEQESNNETEEKSFGALEPPPEPPFLMSMEPPPEPPAMLMTINDDASDDEPSGLVIDDPPPGDVYDPCAVQSDDSSTQDTPLTKPPEIPMALQEKADLVADYSSDSATYNPEMPSYSRTPIIGPMPRPASHASSEEEDECPNFSMYSAASMNLALRSLPMPLDIPVPPAVQQTPEQTDDIPLPEGGENSLASTDKEDLDIPVPPEEEEKTPNEEKQDCEGSQEMKEIQEDEDNLEARKESSAKAEKHVSDSEEEGGEGDDEDEGDEDENKDAPDDQEEESEDDHSDTDEADKTVKSTVTKIKGSETAEDECSTQGDVLDLAIEAETNLENNLPQDENEQEMTLAKSPREGEGKGDGGDKSDGLVDITDEEMSEYDGQDLDKSNENISDSIQREENCKSGESDDDNSLVGGATSAVSAGTLNNSDNVQPQPATATLPGLEGLETETISESEDVNFDEPLEGSDLPEVVLSEEELSSSRKKKRKKYRKTSVTEDSSSKGNNDLLEFEEGEIIEDKPKKESKKDKIKSKQKSEILVEVSENIDVNKSKTPPIEKELTEKKVKEKKKKDKSSLVKDKNKEPKEKTAKVGQVDENVSWKKPSRSTKDRNYRDGKEEKDRDKGKDRDRENKSESSKKDKDKRSREKRKELERYDVRRLISEKPKQPKKDEFGRDISPSKSGSSLSPYRPPRYRSPLRTRNRSRTRSKSRKSRSRSRGRRRRSRSRDRSKRARSKVKARRSRSRNRFSSRSREKRKSIEKVDKNKTRSLSRSKRRSRTLSTHSRRQRSLSLSKSWTPSWSRSSFSRSRSPRRRHKSRSKSRSRSRSWAREQEVSRGPRLKDPPKNLTVIVTNKDALKKKDKKNSAKKKDERRKKRRGQTPAPSKEVFTSGDNILVSVNFKNANKMPELIPGSTPLLRESSKRKRDDVDNTSKRKKQLISSKKSPGAKKSSRLSRINEATRNAKPVAIIDLDLSPFREQTPSPKEVIVLSDSGDEGDKQRSEHNGMTQSMLSLSSIDQGQKNSLSQPESPLSSSFMLNSSGPKTPPEPHIKFSISTKPSQVRMLSNPLMDTEEEMQDENVEDVNEILHKGPNTPPEPPPDLNTPASPPTTPYDPFDPTKSRSVSPQPRSDTGSQQNTSREDKLDSMQSDNDNQTEIRALTPPKDSEEVKMTPESGKIHSTPKADLTIDGSPKVSPPAGPTESNKLFEDSLLKPIQKLLSSANKLDVTVHKSPEKLMAVVMNQQVKNQNQTPKQVIQPKAGTPSKHQTPKSSTKHQLFSSSMLKQVPILGTLPLLASGRQQNGDPSDDMDIDPSSPYSPGSSEAEDLFEPPAPAKGKTTASATNKFDSLFGSSPAKLRHGRHSSNIKSSKRGGKFKSSKGNKKEEIKVKLDEDQLKILDDLPSSAVEMQVKDKFLKKLNRQERVVEEVKLVLKPHYAKKHVTKDEYKDILRRSVPKICHNKSGEINPMKIQSLVEAYVKKFRYAKKKASGGLPSLQNKPKPQKTLWS